MICIASLKKPQKASFVEKNHILQNISRSYRTEKSLSMYASKVTWQLLGADDTWHILTLGVWGTGKWPTFSSDRKNQSAVCVDGARAFKIFGVQCHTDIVWSRVVRPLCAKKSSVLDDPVVWTRQLCRDHKSGSGCLRVADCAWNIVIVGNMLVI